MIKLNDKQKQFLFDNYFITTRMLDSLVYEGWENYFIKNFDFEMVRLESKHNCIYELELIEKTTGLVEYNLLVNFNYKEDDLKKLLNLK